MYENYFALTSRPFAITPDPRFIYLSQRHKEALAHLLYGIKEGDGFVQLTGEVGTGKTTLCRYLLEQISEDIQIALILNPAVTVIELLGNICDELQIDYQKENSSVKTLVDLINQHLLNNYSQGKHTVLIIDEAQNLSIAVLEQIRLLTNLETTEKKLLQIILIGQPELRDLLNKPELLQLSQRITAHYHIYPLSFKETEQYIYHRLIIAGSERRLFTKGAIKTIYQKSQGTPRIINILANRALLGAYAEEKIKVTKAIAKKAVKEMDNPVKKEKKINKNLLFLLALVLNTWAGILLWPFITSYLPWEFKIIDKKIKEEKYIIYKPEKIDEVKVIEEPAVKEVKQVIIEKPPIDIPSLLKKSTSKIALQGLLKAWQQDAIAVEDNFCNNSSSLHCLQDKLSFEEISQINLPIILYITLDNKKYPIALLKIKQEQAYIFIEKEEVISLETLLSFWEEEVLLLWQPPENFKQYTLYQSYRGEEVIWLKQKLNILLKENLNIQSNFFNNKLKQAVIKFQTQENLSPDGIVGQYTLLYMQNKLLHSQLPHLIEDL